jgi:hypothetical protein
VGGDRIGDHARSHYRRPVDHHHRHSGRVERARQRGRQSAYFTDEVGQVQPISGHDGSMDWECLGAGTFRVSLIAVMTDGSQYQAAHDIQCV